MNIATTTHDEAAVHVQNVLERIGTLLSDAHSDVHRAQTPTTWASESAQRLEQSITEALAETRHATELTARADESISSLQALVEAVADGILTLSAEGRIQSINKAACEMFGYTADELLGQDYRLTVPLDQREEFETFLLAFANEECRVEKRLRREVLRRRKNGTTFPMDLHVSTLSLPSRRLIVVVCRDVTEQKAAEAQLAVMTERAVEASRQAGMAELATGVLHNVGNVLNSVNVSTNVLVERVRKSKRSRLTEVAHLLKEHASDLVTYLMRDEKGQKLPEYLERLAANLADEQAAVLVELGELAKNVEHIKNIVHTQQSHACVMGVVESVSLAEVVNDALTITASSFDRYGIALIREFAEMPLVAIDKQRLLQILVNLIRNAKHALMDSTNSAKRLCVRMTPVAADVTEIQVIDNGIGIPRENLTRIFAHGFTTKKDGHGFGLHSSALAAKELGGTLSVCSEGCERGATFTLTLPVRPAEVVKGVPLKMLALSPFSGTSE